LPGVPQSSQKPSQSSWPVDTSDRHRHTHCARDVDTASRTPRPYGAANAVVARRSRPRMAEICTAAPVTPTDALRRVQTGITAQCPGGLTDQRPNAACLMKTIRAHVTKTAMSGPATISATGSLCDRAETTTSLSTGSVTRTASGTSRPTGRSSTTTRPSTSTARSTRCACGSSSRTTSPARKSPAATSSTGTLQAYEPVAPLPRRTPHRLLNTRTTTPLRSL
jgi:hypothetical protein